MNHLRRRIQRKTAVVDRSGDHSINEEKVAAGTAARSAVPKVVKPGAICRACGQRPSGSIHCSRNQQCERADLSKIERHIHDGFLVDGGAETGIGGVHQRRSRFDSYRLFGCADFQHNILRNLLINAERNAGHCHGVETGMDGGKIIGAGGQGQEAVVPGRVRSRAAGHTGARVCRCDCGVWNDRSC